MKNSIFILATLFTGALASLAIGINDPQTKSESIQTVETQLSEFKQNHVTQLGLAPHTYRVGINLRRPNSFKISETEDFIKVNVEPVTIISSEIDGVKSGVDLNEIDNPEILKGFKSYFCDSDFNTTEAAIKEELTESLKYLIVNKPVIVEIQSQETTCNTIKSKLI